MTGKSGAAAGGASGITHEVYATFALALGIGPCYTVGKIWCTEQLIYNIMTDHKANIDADGVLHGQGKVGGAAFAFEFYPGTVDQPTCHRMELDLGAANTPRFPSLCYIVFKDFPLANFGNTLQSSSFKVEVIKLPSHTPTP